MSFVTRNRPVNYCEYCWARFLRREIERTEVLDAEITVHGPDLTRIEMCLPHARILATSLLEESK